MQDPVAARNFQALNTKSFDIKFDLAGTDYEAIENIGTGAYGVVCSATCRQRPGVQVAIKKIPAIFEQRTIAMRTYREIKILKHFRHDNIISIREILLPRADDLATFKDIYIVLDLMESDLHRIIYSQQELTDEHVRYFLFQILRGLKYIHSANVVHRDLKPSNLLVNENCELKIGDFGMARGISSSPEDYNMKMTHYVATRWYRAPELMLLPLNYTAAIDVWSVGCILAEMLGRRPLFQGREYKHQLQLIFDVTGTPSEDYIGLAGAAGLIKDFLRSFEKKTPADLRVRFPTANPKAIRLVGQMLKLDPGSRATVEQALQDPYLSKYHDPDDEPICIPVFDFSFEKQHLDSAALRKAITEEIMEYHKPKPLEPHLTYILQPVPLTELQPLQSACPDTGKIVSLPQPELSAAMAEKPETSRTDVAVDTISPEKSTISTSVDVEMPSAGRTAKDGTLQVINADCGLGIVSSTADENEPRLEIVKLESPTDLNQTVVLDSEQNNLLDAKARIKAALLNAGRRKQRIELCQTRPPPPKNMALQRQKEREEKRRHKLERAQEKKKKSKKKVSMPSGPALTDADRSLLERWQNMARNTRTPLSNSSDDSSLTPIPSLATTDSCSSSDTLQSPPRISSELSSTAQILSFTDALNAASYGFGNIKNNVSTLHNFAAPVASSLSGWENSSSVVAAQNWTALGNTVGLPSVQAPVFPAVQAPYLPFSSYLVPAPTAGQPVSYPGCPEFTVSQRQSVDQPPAVNGAFVDVNDNQTGASKLVNYRNNGISFTSDATQLPSYVEALEARNQTGAAQQLPRRIPGMSSFVTNGGVGILRSGYSEESIKASNFGWPFQETVNGTALSNNHTVSSVGLSNANIVVPRQFAQVPGFENTAAPPQSVNGSANGAASDVQNGLQIITSRLMKSHVDDLTLMHTPKGSGIGYGVGCSEMLMAGDCTDLDNKGFPIDPGSAQISAGLLADWPDVTGDMDASDLEAVLQLELQEFGSPRINLTDLTSLT